LRCGDALPGSRTLAATLGIHRNTVLAALRELENQGWVETKPARGTFVSHALPERPVKATARGPQHAAFDVRILHPPASTAIPDGALALFGGIPDLRRVPRAALARAYRRALRSTQGLGYGEPAGHPDLRKAIASMLARTRGLAVAEHDIVITRGSQMALDLLARTLLGPGMNVAVEALGYPPAWASLRATGANLIPIPLDDEGLRVDRLASTIERTPIRAVYLTPHHQYPTTVTLSAARRRALVELALEHRVALLEDDFDHEFHYEGRPILPLASQAPESVAYIGTLSKVLAPGLRLGFLVAPSPLRESVIAMRTYVDRQGDLVLERALAELFEDGEIQRHILRMRRIYRSRRDTFVRLLQDAFGDDLRFAIPHGGMALWAHVPNVDVEAWAVRARERNVLVQVARIFAFDGRPRPYLRLGYGCLEEDDLARAVATLSRTFVPALRSTRRRPPSRRP